MRQLKPSVKTAIVSTLVVSSTAIGIYAVENAKENKVEDIGNRIKLDIAKVDSDTVKVSLDNIQDIPKALQFSIKLDGNVKLANGEGSIHDLVNEEAQKRIKEKTVVENKNNILTDYTYNEDTNTIDVLITSDSSIPKTNNRIDVLELDVKESSSLKNGAPSYKVVPANEDEYKYVSANNKEYSGLGVVHDNQAITMNIAPTINSNKPYVEVVEGETLELTPDNLGITIEDKDGDAGLRLEVKENGKVITAFKKDTPGIYNLECYAIDSYNDKSETLTTQVNVKLEEVTQKPVITKDGKALEDITINGGDIFKPLENVKALDAKGREIEVKLSVDKELNLDPGTDTTYNLTYTATDIYSNKTEITITLTVVANKAPIISGVKDHTLKVGDKFNPREGVEVNDEDKDIELNIDSNVDTSVAGKYKVLYSATDSKGKTTRLQSEVVVNQKVSVVNNVPVISAEDKSISVGDKFEVLDGVTASDNEDGDITKDIKVLENDVDTSKVGVYNVRYSIEDSQGAKATKAINVEVKVKEIAQNIEIVSGDGTEEYPSEIIVKENAYEESIKDLIEGIEDKYNLYFIEQPKEDDGYIVYKMKLEEKTNIIESLFNKSKSYKYIEIKVNKSNTEAVEVLENLYKEINESTENLLPGEGLGPDGDVMPEVTPEPEKPGTDTDTDGDKDEPGNPGTDLETDEDNDEVEKPGTDLETGEDKDEVEKPGTDLETGEDKDEVEKPGTDLETGEDKDKVEKPDTGTNRGETETTDKSPTTGDLGVIGFAMAGLVAGMSLLGINYKKK